MELCSIKKKICMLRNLEVKNVGPMITHHITALGDIWFGLQSTVWLGHDTITTMGSLVVKGLITFVGMSVLLVIIQPTYIGLVSLCRIDI